MTLQNRGGAENNYTKKIGEILSYEDWTKYFKEYKSYFKDRFKILDCRCQDFIRLGGNAKNKPDHPKIPNGFPLIIDKAYQTPAHIIQAVTKIMATRLFLRLEEFGCDCVFEIHDSAVHRIPVDLHDANIIMHGILREMLNELELDWDIPGDSQLVKCKELKFGCEKVGEIGKDGDDASSHLKAV